ncbi:hypothetical protein GJ496_001886 [Pomphorhynchus laevis]|nr:hypothetical protein GJ496_001886 [Pomphorhynchus laevis]
MNRNEVNSIKRFCLLENWSKVNRHEVNSIKLICFACKNWSEVNRTKVKSIKLFSFSCENWSKVNRHEVNSIKLFCFACDYWRKMNRHLVILYIPSSKWLLMNTYPGHFQFVNGANESICYQFDVTNENHIKCLDVKANILQIEAACICSEDRWLACSIVRNCEEPIVPYRELRLFRIGKWDKVLRSIISVKSNMNPSIAVTSLRFCSYKLSSQQIPLLYACTSKSAIVQWEFEVQINSVDSKAADQTSNITVVCKNSEVISLAHVGQPVSICSTNPNYGVCAFTGAMIKFKTGNPSFIIDREYIVVPNDPIRYVQALERDLYVTVHKCSFTIWDLSDDIKPIKQNYLSNNIAQFTLSPSNIIYYSLDVRWKGGEIYRFDLNQWTGECIYSSKECYNSIALCSYSLIDDEDIVIVVKPAGDLLKIQKSTRKDRKSNVPLEQDTNSNISRLSALLNNQICYPKEKVDSPNEMAQNEIIESAINELSKVQTFLMPPIHSFASSFLDALIPRTETRSMPVSIVQTSQIRSLHDNQKEKESTVYTQCSEKLHHFTFEQLLEAYNN